MSVMIQDSLETFADIQNLRPGQRHVLRCRRDGYMHILPFGPQNSYAHILFHEVQGGPVIDSALLLPDTIANLAAEALPLNHLEPRSVSSLRSLNTQEQGSSDVRDALKEVAKQEPAEARPDEKDPEAIQSLVESGIFNQLKSKELVETTLKNVFGDNGVKIQPGNLVDRTFLDKEETLPIREIIYFITREGRPIIHAYFNTFYDANKLPTLIIDRSVKKIDSRIFRKVMVEQTQKSSSFSAGLTLGLSSPTNVVSSGPTLGDPVHSKGKAVASPGGGGTTLGFSAGFTKTHNRLRIEAEIEVQDELGEFVTNVTRIPPISG